jgi:hypothetical protein
MLAHFYHAFARHAIWYLASIALIAAWLWPEIRRWRVRHSGRRQDQGPE